MDQAITREQAHGGRAPRRASATDARRAWLPAPPRGGAGATLDLLLDDEDCRAVLARAGLVERSGDGVALTEAGRAHAEAPDAEALFERLHAAYVGLLEVLVLADAGAVGSAARGLRLFEGLVERRYHSPDPVAHRLGWLVALGLVERGPRGAEPTALGRQILGAHAPEVAALRGRIDDLLDEDRETDASIAEALGEDVDASDDHVISGGGAITAPARPLVLDPAAVRAHAGHLDLPASVIERACAALASDKHLLLVGPPGTGKTELAVALGEAARAGGFCEGVLTATASGDWTTYDTIGGYAIAPGGALRFRPGVFLSAIERRAWLLVDELNRADVDRAFGELLTVLSGRDASAPFALPDGRLVCVGPSPRATHRVPPSFRLLATMNTWDRAALFRLSYAVQRRFAIVHVGAPDDAAYARLLERHAREGDAPPLDDASLAALLRLFSAAGLLAHRPIGPAIALDMVRYLRRRGEPGEGLAEAFTMYLLPQLEGLAPDAATAIWALLDAEAARAPEHARRELLARFRELFPGARAAIV
ncbi:MAG: AAA family ATPase [Minicystis sp.]